MNRYRAVAIAGLVLLSCGCERQAQNMYDQSHHEPLERSAVFADEGAARVPPAGTEVFARDAFSDSSSGREGREAAALRARDIEAAENPYALTLSFMQRGRDRFNIYCAPCHSPVGDGDGFIVRRGFPAPPSYHTERLRSLSDRYLFDVISSGYGIMYSYADRVAPADRWAIVAYVRALQLSRNAPVSALTANDRARLEARP